MFRCVLSIGLCVVGSVSAQSEIRPTNRYAPAIEPLAKLIDYHRASKRLPAVSIALVDDQTVVWAKGFGFSDPEQRIPATAETIYRVGSVSKLFTDLAVMQLVEAGKLNLDAPITKYLPEFRPINPSGKPITLRQLMTHRSGLLREPPLGNYFDPHNLSLAQMVESLNTTELVYPPETKVKYSNAGVAVVGYVLEKTQGERFGTYVRRKVLEPLEMKRSFFEPDPKLMQDVAKSIMWTLHGREFAAPTFELGMAPAGCMYSTVLDLAKFLKVLAKGGEGLLQQATLEEMWRPQFAPQGTKTGIGLGFFIDSHRGQRRIGHNGAMYGFATELAYLPDLKLGVVVAISCDCANPVAHQIAGFALDSMLAVREGKKVPDFQPTAPVSDEWRRRLIGTWVDEKSERGYTVQDVGGRLWLWPHRGGVRVELRQLAEDLVSDDRLGLGTKIQWIDGRPHLNGQALSRREMDTPPPAPPERWRGLIGEYGEDHNVLSILEWNGQLVALIEWFFIYPLKEISRDVFQFPEFGLYHDEKVIFERDANGKATKVVAASVTFKRRQSAGENGKTFRIRPVRQLDGLRREALAATPPQATGDLLPPDLVDITKVEPGIKLDIRYATENNFLSTPLYSSARAYLQRPAAEALARVHRKLAAKGYGLLVHDAYRPWYVTYMFREATPAKWHHFVADPKQGSRHNRGCAVDLTLYDLRTGEAVEMVGGYDEFSDRSYPNYFGGTSRQRWHRDLLRQVMEAEGFTVYEAEWWHFDYKDWRRYPILNKPFEDLP